MSQKHFGDLGFALGQVRGARTWRAIGFDDLGRTGTLTGLYYRQLWVPGINHAECRKPKSGTKMSEQNSEGGPIERGHLATCRCGFYAFYDNSNDYWTPNGRLDHLVTGMVEGFGEVLIGTRGFRCTQARIVALTIDPGLPQRDEVMALYPGIPVFTDFRTMEREFPNDDGGERRRYLESLT